MVLAIEVELYQKGSAYPSINFISLTFGLRTQQLKEKGSDLRLPGDLGQKKEYQDVFPWRSLETLL